MTSCLAPDEFVDLTDGTLSPERQAHVASCAACRALAREVRAALELATSAEVPEPSPFFWAGLNRRVQAEIAHIAPDARRAWWQWQTVMPMAALAVLVVALTSTVERGPAPVVPRAAESAAGIAGPDVIDAAPGAADDALAMMIDLAADLPEGGWDALGMHVLPEMGEAATALSPEEQRALAALLHSVTDRPSS